MVWQSPPTTNVSAGVRDAQGNVLGVYEYNGNAPSNMSKGEWTEQHLYGSSRLGMLTPKWDISGHVENTYQPNFEDHTQDIGKRIYELPNHLGNVMATVSDKKIGHDNGSGTVDYYEADVISAQDYYPFGMGMPGRGYGTQGRYGFNGKERDPNISTEDYDFGARIYDGRIGRWLSVDKLHMMAPSWSPYRGFFDNPIYWTDPDGNLEWPLKGTKAANKKDLPGGIGDANTIVRTSYYREIRNKGTSPHIGIDYRASIGTPVYSLGDGLVSGMYTTSKGIVILEVSYGDGDRLRFLHLSKYASGLKVGSKVKEGQIIAYSGNSGGYPAHLHVDGVDKNGKGINPEAKNYGTMTNESFFGNGAKSNLLNEVFADLRTVANLVTLSNQLLTSGLQKVQDVFASLKSGSLASESYTVNTRGSNLNLRSSASIGNNVIGTIDNGSNLKGTGKSEGDWREVSTSDGKTGWVNSQFLKK